MLQESIMAVWQRQATWFLYSYIKKVDEYLVMKDTPRVHVGRILLTIGYT